MASPLENQSDLFGEIGALTDAVVLGMATSAERARLNQLVTESDDARWAYVRYIHDTVSIHRRLQENQLVGELRLSPLTAERSGDSGSVEVSGESAGVSDESLLAWLSQFAEEGIPYVLHGHLASPASYWRDRQWQRLLRQSAWGLACGLLVVVGVAIGWFSSSGGLFDRNVAVGEGVRFARILRSTDCAWKLNGIDAQIHEGDWLSTGRYTLSSGLAKLVFPWGTEATLEAPTEFEFNRDGSRQLWHGQLVAKVSPEDTGFTIDTPTVQLIDLGTEFGLSTDLKGESEVHVFKGAVEVRPHFVDGRSESRSITLSTGEANGFASRDLAVRQIAFNPKRFSRAWRLNNSISSTTGAMRFQHPAPVSVVEGKTEANDVMALFLEREDQILPEALPVTATEPGLYTTFNNRFALLPAGSHVDSYLVHFDPVGSRNVQAPVIAEGSVSFDKPILAVIARGDQLAASDEWLACRETQYQGSPVFRQKKGEFFSSNIAPSYAVRGLSGLWNVAYSHESPAPNDWFRLSADRKTLTVRCVAGGEADQLRILVSADGEFHPGVVAAQPTHQSKPFYGHPFKVGQIIEAEDFDLGGQDVAYNDTTPDSLSNVYRGNESVELKQYLVGEQTITNVSIARAGEWLAYTVEVDEPGLYVIEAHAGSLLGGGKFRFEIGQVDTIDPVVTSSVDIPVTSLEKGGLDRWYETVRPDPVKLNAGQQVLRVVMEANHSSGRLGNFDWFRIRQIAELENH